MTQVGKGPNPQREKTWLAEAAITRYRFVIPGTSDGEVKTSGAAAVNVIGVAAEKAAIAEDILITHEGSQLVEAGAAVVIGALVKSDANGKAVSITPNAGGATYVGAAGRATGAASADGDLIVIDLTPANLVIET